MGVLAEEPLPPGAPTPPSKSWADARLHSLQPEFIPDDLVVDGKPVFKPDFDMGDKPYQLWAFGVPRSHYFFSATGNFETLYTGEKTEEGLPAPLPSRPAIPGVSPLGAPLSSEEKETHGSLAWRLQSIGAEDKWAGEDWEQSPPDLDDYATAMQERAWALRMGIHTGYREGSSPERIFQASSLVWALGFGCLALFEDAAAMSPASQWFSRDGNGTCIGTHLKKTQFVCAMLVFMLQVALCPFENMQTWSSSSPSPNYPGQDLKLRHLRWLVDNILTSTRNDLAAHLGAYDGDEELWANRVVSATQIFVSKWFPHGSPSVPEVEQCVRLADELPFTHSVSGAEERTVLGLPSLRELLQ